MANVILLDGGIGQELVRRAGDKPTPLWSTQVMLDRPHLVEELHRDFFRAGATVATTNTYAVLHDRLERVGIQGAADDLVTAAISAAASARNASGGGFVAGSIGPLGATYRPDLCPSPEDAVLAYADPISRLKGRVDVLLFETMSSITQAEGALRAAEGHEMPVWLALTVDESDGACLRSGEPLADVAPLVHQYRPDAVLINCSPPEVIQNGLEVVRGFGRPFGAYANGFTRISEEFLTEAPTADVLERRQDLTPAAYASFAMDWVALGATIVGGCCEVGPEHISKVAQILQQAGHTIVQP